MLDTLLLSAVMHPNQESHWLEAITLRFDITVIGRHSALGDAMVTAEVLLKLIPLLAEKGIHTLGHAREARRLIARGSSTDEEQGGQGHFLLSDHVGASQI